MTGVASIVPGAITWPAQAIDARILLQELVGTDGEYETDEIKVHIIGFAKIVGDISDGAKSVVWFFLVAFVPLYFMRTPREEP